MAVALFLGMWFSRVLVIGPLGFLLALSSQSRNPVGEEIPSTGTIGSWTSVAMVALAYAIAVTVALNLLFLPDTPQTAAHRPKPKNLLVADAFTNPAHVRFRPQSHFRPRCFVTFFIQRLIGRESTPRSLTCTFIALESTEATLHKGTLRIVGCVMAVRSRSSPSYSSCHT